MVLIPKEVVIVKKIFLAAVFLFAFVLGASSQANAVINVDARYWFTTFSDSVQLSSGSVVGTNLNLVDDLNVDDKKNFWEGRVSLELGSHSLRYGYMPLSWDGTKTLSQTVVFNGQTYTAGASVDTKLSADYHRLGYEYDIIDLLDNKLGVIFEIKYFDADARLSAPSIGLNESGALKAPIPTIGVAAQVGLPFLINVGGEITGVSAGSKIYLVDAEAGVNFKPAPFVVISGGYRILKFHVEKDNDKVDLTLKGPFVMLRADF